MEKIVVGPSCKNAVDLDAPVIDNLKNIAKRITATWKTGRHRARSSPPREADHRDSQAGARIRLIGDGDLSAGIAAAVIGTGVHAVMGRRRSRGRDHRRRHSLPERIHAGPPGDR